MFHGHLDYFQEPPLGGRLNTKPGDHGTPNTHNHFFILFYQVWGPSWIKKFIELAFGWGLGHVLTSHYTWRPVTVIHDFGGVLGRPLDTFFRARAFGLSKFHGHGSWLVCEVALNPKPKTFPRHCYHPFKFMIIYHVSRWSIQPKEITIDGFILFHSPSDHLNHKCILYEDSSQCFRWVKWDSMSPRRQWFMWLLDFRVLG
jgi:hypothetical protein